MKAPTISIAAIKILMVLFALEAGSMTVSKKCSNMSWVCAKGLWQFAGPKPAKDPLSSFLAPLADYGYDMVITLVSIREHLLAGRSRSPLEPKIFVMEWSR
jgi:hypothetical protein